MKREIPRELKQVKLIQVVLPDVLINPQRPV